MTLDSNQIPDNCKFGTRKIVSSPGTEDVGALRISGLVMLLYMNRACLLTKESSFKAFYM